MTSQHFKMQLLHASDWILKSDSALFLGWWSDPYTPSTLYALYVLGPSPSGDLCFGAHYGLNPEEYLSFTEVREDGTGMSIQHASRAIQVAYARYIIQKD